MKDKSKRGGQRTNAGRKPTGRNTETVSFSVHKSFVPVINATVREKVAELKALQAQANETGEPVTITLLPQQPIPTIALPKNELVAELLNTEGQESPKKAASKANSARNPKGDKKQASAKSPVKPVETAKKVQVSDYMKKRRGF